VPRRIQPFKRLKQGLLYVTGVLRETYEAWRDDRAIRLGAGLAYYGLLALVPMLILAVVLASLVFSQSEIQEYVTEYLDNTIEIDVDQFSQEVAKDAQSTSVRGGLGVLGLVAVIIAASFLFLAVEDALKVIWHEPVTPGFRYTIKRRLLAALVALLSGSLLLASLIITSVLSFAERLAPDLYLVDAATQAAITAGSWAVAVGFLALLVQILVRKRVSWIALFVGGTVTALVMNIGTGLAWSYLSSTADRGITGVAGGVILVLIWIYYVAQMFIGGAELTKVLDRRIRPDEQENSA